MAENSTPFVKIGGNASGATQALTLVQQALVKLGQIAAATGAVMHKSFSGLGSVMGGLKATFSGIGSVMGGLFGVLRKVGDFIGGGLTWAYNKLKWGVLGVTAALVASYYEWNKSALIQSRLGSLLKANTQNYQQAQSKIMALGKSALRGTNFSDEDVMGVFTSLISTNQQKGANFGFRNIGGILNAAAARGTSPEDVAFAIGKALETREATALRRQGIIVDERRFKRNPERELEQVLARFENVAADQRRMAPFGAFQSNLKEVFEAMGSKISTFVNPALERMANLFLRFSEFIEKASWKEMFTAFYEYGSDAWKLIVANAMTAWDWIREKFNKSVLADWAKSVYEFFGGDPLKNAIVDGIVGAIKKGWADFIEWAKGKAAPITRFNDRMNQPTPFRGDMPLFSRKDVENWPKNINKGVGWAKDSWNMNKGVLAGGGIMGITPMSSAAAYDPGVALGGFTPTWSDRTEEHYKDIAGGKSMKTNKALQAWLDADPVDIPPKLDVNNLNWPAIRQMYNETGGRIEPYHLAIQMARNIDVSHSERRRGAAMPI